MFMVNSCNNFIIIEEEFEQNRLGRSNAIGNVTNANPPYVYPRLRNWLVTLA